MEKRVLHSFINRDYRGAREALNTLMSSQRVESNMRTLTPFSTGQERDRHDIQPMESGKGNFKALHNQALIDFGITEHTDLKGLLSALLSLYARKKRPLSEDSSSSGEAVSTTDAENEVTLEEEMKCNAVDNDESILLYNIALVYYHLRQLHRCTSILESLFRHIVAIEEVVAIRIAFLLLETYCHVFRSLIHYNVEEAVRFNSLTSSVFAYLDRPHVYNSSQKGKDESGGEKVNSTTSSPEVIEFRYRLKLFKAKVKLIQGDIKVGKKEVKSALELFQKEMKDANGTGGGDVGGASDEEDDVDEEAAIMSEAIMAGRMNWWELGGKSYNTSALFLKAHLEYLKNNFRKSVILLNSCLANEIEESIYYNSLGCIHYRKRNFRVASLYFGQALTAQQSFPAKFVNGRIVTPIDKPEIMYNAGLALLRSEEYLLALKTLYNTAPYYGKRPNLWLRIAESCVLAHAKSTSDRKSKLIRGRVAPGNVKGLSLVLLSLSRPPSESANTHPGLNLEFAYTSLRNALYLIYCSETQLPPNATDDRLRLEQLKCYGLVVTAYVTINLQHYLATINTCKQLLSMASCPPQYKTYARLYITDALCHLNRSKEAMDYLSPTDISPAATGGLTEGVRLRSGLLVNLAIAHILQNDLSRAEVCVRQALVDYPQLTEAILLLVYILLRQGDVVSAVYVLRIRELPPPIKSPSLMEVWIVEHMSSPTHISKAKFGTCIYDKLMKGCEDAKVTVEEWEGRVVLSRGSGSVTPFSHAIRCPSRQMEKEGIPVDPTSIDQEVKVGVVVLPQRSKDGSILLSKRSPTLRSFPSAWVFPGGGIDPGETLMEAGLRELTEETGIVGNKDKLRMIAVWESNYPILVEVGPLKRQHIVVYYLVEVEDEEVKLSIQPHEVASIVWLSREHISKLASASPSDSCNDSLDENIPCLNSPSPPEGSSWGTVISQADMKKGFITIGSINKNLTEGSRFAIKFV